VSAVPQCSTATNPTLNAAQVPFKTLAKVLAGQGAVLLEAQSANPPVFDASDVATVMVAPGDDSMSESDAPGC
jgi:hypothetical protein